MGDRIAPIIERLEEKGEETLAFFRAMSPEDWDVIVYDDGADWTVRDVLCHFVSAERAYVRFMREEFEGGVGVPEDFDIDGFNVEEVAAMPGIPPSELIADFATCRAETILFVSGLDDEDLDREGRHPFLGVDKVEKFLKLLYRHLMIHQRDIRRVLNRE